MLDGPAHGIHIYRIFLILQYHSSKLAGLAGYWQIRARSIKYGGMAAAILDSNLNVVDKMLILVQLSTNWAWYCYVFVSAFCYCKHKIAVFSNQMSTNSATISINDALFTAPVQAWWHRYQCCGTGAKLDIEDKQLAPVAKLWHRCHNYATGATQIEHL